MNLFPRSAFYLTAFALLLAALPSARAQISHYDLVLKGGHVRDPANHMDGIMDVAVSAGKIAAVAKDIPASSAAKVVDVTGLYVTPGLIDIHYHIGHGGAPLNWFDPEARDHDAGSSGADTFLQEKNEVIDHAKVRVLAFLNIVANGMQGGLEQTVDQMDVKHCADTINKYSDLPAVVIHMDCLLGSTAVLIITCMLLCKVGSRPDTPFHLFSVRQDSRYL